MTRQRRITLKLGNGTITADNGHESLWRQALPALTASYSGFVNGDTASSLTTQVTLVHSGSHEQRDGGSYTINARGAVDPNYSISYATGTLTIGQAGVDDHGRQSEA